MTLHTPLCDELDVEVPVVQAPIGSATCPDLAAAVTEAGALGSLAVSWRTPAEAREAVARTRELTDGPVMVNAVLADETGVADPREQVAACLDAGADHVSLSFGDPDPALVERVHDADATALVTVGSAAEARKAEVAGADCVVAQGWEAGGHLQSEVATMPLVPRVADAVDVPVVAAGGIADGRGVAAALALGADAAWLGTRFVATEEAAVERAYSEAVAAADETDTVRSTLFDRGWPDQPHRTLRNETVERWVAAGRPERDRPGEGERIGTYPDGTPIERYGDDIPVAGSEGDHGAMALYAGQSAGLTDEVRPASEVVEALVAETEAALDRP